MTTPNPQQQIERPAGGDGSGNDPAYFVMPEEYRHGAVGKKIAEPKPEVSKPTVTTAPPVPPPPPKPPVAVSAKAARVPRHMRPLLAGGAVLIIGLAVAGYVVLRSTATPAVVPEERPATRPAQSKPKEPEPEPEAAVEPEPTETRSPFPAAVVPGTDTDSDGLTDAEETLIYGTNPRLPDTDSDGFLDGNEVYHRYNPNGTAPGTLLESGLVVDYAGPMVAGEEIPGARRYRLIYPSVWAIKDATSESLDSPVTLVANGGEAVEISLAKTGVPDVDPIAWYRESGLDEKVHAVTTKNGYAALVTDDQLSAYVFSTDLVFILKMDTGAKATIDYLQTFQMIINSIQAL